MNINFKKSGKIREFKLFREQVRVEKPPTLLANRGGRSVLCYQRQREVLGEFHSLSGSLESFHTSACPPRLLVFPIAILGSVCVREYAKLDLAPLFGCVKVKYQQNLAHGSPSNRFAGRSENLLFLTYCKDHTSSSDANGNGDDNDVTSVSEPPSQAPLPLLVQGSFV